ncbi:hypothetical protein [Streptomyces sp. NPDC048669]|uniref:hypothetical protein n=1 Tax=Streptomyces sp. NPDC048669 TaxID=3155267 RepID=UPI003442751E
MSDEGRGEAGMGRVCFGKLFPPGRWLVVPLPGDETYRELVPRGTLSPWLARNIRGQEVSAKPALLRRAL